MKVFIACPYTEGYPPNNVNKSIKVMSELIDKGFIPYNPILCHYVHVKHPKDYSVWAFLSLKYLEVCDAVLRLPGISPGADAEVDKANELGIPVFYTVGSLIEIKKLKENPKGLGRGNN